MMKTKLGIVLLVVVCVGLVIALVVGKKQADTQRKKDADAILDFSNQLTTASASLDELRQVNLMLTNDLDASRQALVTLSNQYVATSASLSNTKVALETARDQIADLEAQNQALDQRAAEMTNAIANLSAQITETQMKLVKSETNNVFLENELKRQIAQKAELERKFNDLSQVRAQVRKLRDDLFVARRLEWTREGTNPAKQQKGAQLLMARTGATNGIVRPPGYNLNVEVGSEGSVKVVPAPTNTPAMTNLWRW
jgi:chromosome segregation ATPase